MSNAGKKKRTERSQPTLSLCMIVKNEEELLGQCLESVQDVVDEMIIVDTGSTDRTVEIAENFGAKIYHHPWQGSFSEARNYGLQFATCDWVLQLDADEALEREDIPLLKKTIQPNRYAVLFVKILNESKEGWTMHYFQRLFRRGKAVYAGIVHNQLVYRGNDLVTEIRVYHYGYNLSKEIMAAKHGRTEALLLKQLEEDPTNPFHYQNYVRILRAQRKFEEGVRAGRKAMVVCLDRMEDYHFQMIAFDTANCLMGLGRAEEAEMLCRRVLKEHPDNMDILYVLAGSLNKQKTYQEAVDAYRRYLAINEKTTGLNPQLIYDTYSMAHKAWALISNCCFEMGDLEGAQEAAEKAIALRPEISMYKIPLARILLEKNRVEEAEKLLNTEHTENQANPEFYKRWAKLCVKYPFMGNPLEKLTLGLERHPDSDDLLNEYGYAVQQSNPQAAKKHWKKAIQINPLHIGAHAGLAQLYGREARSDALEIHADVILERCHQKGLLKEIGRTCMNMQLYSKAVDLFTRCLSIEPEDADSLTDVATCYARMGQYEASFLGYKEALRLSPQNPTILEKMRHLQREMEQSMAEPS